MAVTCKKRAAFPVTRDQRASSTTKLSQKYPPASSLAAKGSSAAASSSIVRSKAESSSASGARSHGRGSSGEAAAHRPGTRPHRSTRGAPFVWPTATTTSGAIESSVCRALRTPSSETETGTKATRYPFRTSLAMLASAAKAEGFTRTAMPREGSVQGRKPKRATSTGARKESTSC